MNNLIKEHNTFASIYQLKEVIIDDDKWCYIDSETKDRPVLILLHGTRGNPFVFWNQFNALDTKLRLISIKLPLLHDMKQMSEGLLSLTQKLSIGSFNLLGTSIGGYIAQWFVYYYPENVEKLFICNSIINGDDLKNPSYFFSKYILPRIPYIFIVKKFHNELKKSDKKYKALNQYLYQNILKELSSKEFSERALSFYWNNQISNLEFSQDNILIIDSDDDPYIPKIAQKKVLDKYPKAVHHSFNNAHHFPYIISPVMFNSIVLREIIKIN